MIRPTLAACMLWLAAVATAQQGASAERFVRAHDLAHLQPRLLRTVAAPAPGPGDAPDLPIDDFGAAPPAPAAPAPADAPGAAPPDPLVSPDGPQALATFVRAFVDPPLGDDDDVQVLGKRWLVVLGNEAQHQWLDRLLARGRAEARAQRPLMTVRAQWMRLPDLAWQQDVAPVLGERVSAVTALQPGPETDRFVAALQQKSEGIVEMPVLEPVPLAAIHCEHGNRTAYVRDLQLELAQGAAIADPVIDVVQDGLALTLVAARLHDGAPGLAATFHASDLQQPIPTVSVNLGVGNVAAAVIQTPQLQRASVTAAVEPSLPCVLVVALPPSRFQRYVALVRLEPPPAAK